MAAHLNPCSLAGAVARSGQAVPPGENAVRRGRGVQPNHQGVRHRQGLCGPTRDRFNLYPRFFRDHHRWGRAHCNQVVRRTAAIAV